MLKITYTELGIHLEYLSQSLEEWIARRVIFSLQIGQRLLIERCTASLLLPIQAIDVLDAAIACREAMQAISLYPCDHEHLELTLTVTWLTTNPAAEEGICVAALPSHLEQLIFNTWQASQLQRSVS